MIIEKYEHNQAKEIKEIINKMWPSKTIEEIAQSLQNEKEAIFIAKVVCKIVGFVHGIIKNDYIEGVSEYPALYVEGIFVEENYRHQRVASSLIEKLVEFGKERNIKEIASECREDNYESYDWHKKNNFEVCSKIIHFIKIIN